MKQNCKEAIKLLQKLVSTPSFSQEEDKTAKIIEQHLNKKGIPTHGILNNVWAFNKHFSAEKPTILLNSHHDTVKANSNYTLDPFSAEIIDETLYGLGSNDAGASLVCLMTCFLHFYAQENLKFNLIFTATAEEEISGKNGIAKVLPLLGEISFGIVGEPTNMHLAIAEKGLIVLDCVTQGIAGHSARDEGQNAIYNAIKDIEWFRNFQFPLVSKTLGQVKMSVTMIGAGMQHNMVPDTCRFTVDIRTTDAYTNQEIIDIIQENVTCEIKPRSLRLNSSSIALNHPFVKAGKDLGRKNYGSPTLSDQALMNFPSLKIGPGDSARSHSADEFIHLKEIEEGIDLYIRLLEKFSLKLNTNKQHLKLYST